MRDAEIRVDHYYPHPPAAVWKALTDPELHARWWARACEPVRDASCSWRRATAVGRGSAMANGMQPHVEAARESDCAAVARIYNEGIEDRLATFETRPRSPQEVAGWLDGRYPVVVVRQGGAVRAFAACSEYRPRACYRDIAEFSVYVAREARGRGLGGVALDGLAEAAVAAGLRKLVSRVFVENVVSRRLLARKGFREVGVYRRHGRLDGAWRDVVIVERLLDE